VEVHQREPSLYGHTHHWPIQGTLTLEFDHIHLRRFLQQLSALEFAAQERRFNEEAQLGEAGLVRAHLEPLAWGDELQSVTEAMSYRREEDSAQMSPFHKAKGCLGPTTGDVKGPTAASGPSVTRACGPVPSMGPEEKQCFSMAL